MSVLKSYDHTIVGCYIGYVVQAIVNNFAPLLFITFQNSYGIELEKITMLITVNFGVQLLGHETNSIGEVSLSHAGLAVDVHGVEKRLAWLFRYFESGAACELIAETLHESGETVRRVEARVEVFLHSTVERVGWGGGGHAVAVLGSRQGGRAFLLVGLINHYLVHQAGVSPHKLVQRETEQRCVLLFQVLIEKSTRDLQYKFVVLIFQRHYRLKPCPVCRIGYVVANYTKALIPQFYVILHIFTAILLLCYKGENLLSPAMLQQEIQHCLYLCIWE